MKGKALIRINKAGPGTGLNWRGLRRFAHPADEAGLALTRGTMALVIAPEKHPFEIRLRSKREAGLEAQRTQGDATPVIEALHVPLHLDQWCWNQTAVRRHAHEATIQGPARAQPADHVALGRLG